MYTVAMYTVVAVDIIVGTKDRRRIQQQNLTFLNLLIFSYFSLRVGDKEFVDVQIAKSSFFIRTKLLCHSSLVS